jgi:glucan-binding YG repeat protein
MFMDEEGLAKKLPDFDPDFSFRHPANQEAARQRGWVYDPQIGYYIDEDGCLMADEYGQDLG